jgi:hypothetical protein
LHLVTSYITLLYIISNPSVVTSTLQVKHDLLVLIYIFCGLNRIKRILELSVYVTYYANKVGLHG